RLPIPPRPHGGQGTPATPGTFVPFGTYVPFGTRPARSCPDRTCPARSCPAGAVHQGPSHRDRPRHACARHVPGTAVHVTNGVPGDKGPRISAPIPVFAGIWRARCGRPAGGGALP